MANTTCRDATAFRRVAVQCDYGIPAEFHRHQAREGEFFRTKRAEPLHSWHIPDPKDDLILEVAVAAGATHIVTYNGRDFRGADQFGLMVVTPVELLRERGEL